MSEEKKTLTFSQEQFGQLLEAIQLKPMNALEQKQYQEQMEREKRRNLMQVESARIEMEKQKAKKFSCSHSRDQQGNSAPRGQGIWTTQGQVHGDDSITLICMRCGNTWHWKATPQERDLAINGSHGLLGFCPPDESRLIQTEASA